KSFTLMDINLYFDPDNPDNNIITNEFHLFLQEIEIAIKTGAEEMWGYRYSIDLKKYIFNQYITLPDVENEISTFIGNFTNYSHMFQYSVNAELVEIDKNVVLYIKTTITDPDNNQKLTHKFILG